MELPKREAKKKCVQPPFLYPFSHLIKQLRNRGSGMGYTEGMSLLRLNNVTMKYGDKPVLRNVYFKLNEGERVGLIGKNGTGKNDHSQADFGADRTDRRNRRARTQSQSQLLLAVFYPRRKPFGAANAGRLVRRPTHSRGRTQSDRSGSRNRRRPRRDGTAAGTSSQRASKK